MKQTAVEWFFRELERMQYFIGNDMLEAYKQAKLIEKEQIIDFVDNLIVGMSREKIEQYYNETFKQD